MRTISTVLGTIAASFAIRAFADVNSLEVVSTSQELVGISASVPGGGSADNFPSQTIVAGVSYASFRLNDSVANTPFADLRITVTDIFGTLSTGTAANNGLMIARTVNSQGFVDTGTISVLSGFSAEGALNQGSYVTLRFDFYTPNGLFDTPKTAQVGLTSFDIDFLQFNRIQKSEFESITVELLTQLATEQDATTIRIEDAPPSGDSTFGNSKFAVSMLSHEVPGFTLEMGKLQGSGNSLFMFEFRNPSENITFGSPIITSLPEVSPSLGSGVIRMGFLVGFAHWRRSRSAPQR